VKDSPSTRALGRALRPHSGRLHMCGMGVVGHLMEPHHVGVGAELEGLDLPKDHFRNPLLKST